MGSIRRAALLAFVVVAMGCDHRGGRNSSGVSPASAERSDLPHAMDPGALCAAASTSPSKGETALDRRLAHEARIAAAHPEMTDPWLALGRSWVEKARKSADPGFYLNADACAAVALELDPGNVVAENLRGFSYLNDHRFRDAHALATRVLAAHPDDPTAWGTLSDAALELGDVDGAERAAQHMLDLKPGLSAYGRAAYLRWLRGDVRAAKVLGADAVRAGREAKDHEPAAWVAVQTALVFWNAGDYAGALAGFELAGKMVPGYAPALVGEGRVALARHDYAAAAEAFREAYRVAPLVETAWLLGDAERLAGHEAEAEAAYARVVSEGRLHDRRTLSLFLASRKGDAREAVALAEAEFAERPGVYTKDALAWALHRSGRHAEAAKLLGELVALGVPDARVLFHAGAARLAGGDPSGREFVRRALAQNPEFDAFDADEARRLVVTRGPA